MHHHRSGIVGVCCLAVVALPQGCSSGDTDPQEGSIVSSSSGLTTSSFPHTIHKEVRVGTDNLVAVHTLPSALCMMHSPNANDPAEDLALGADADGVVYYHVDPDSVGDTTEISLDCQDESGSSASYSVKTEATVDAPIVTMPPPRGPLRPALTGDPLALSQSELIARGYPPRPDPTQVPESYQRWLGIVSQPVIMGTGKSVRLQTNLRFTADTQSPVWAGYGAVQNSQARGPFEYIQAYWIVPAGGQRNGTTRNIVSFWVGLGSGIPNPLSDIYQAGLYIAKTPDGATVYRLWDELINVTPYCGCCFPPNEYTGWCPDPNPGDAVLAEVWFGDSVGNFKIIPGDGNSQYLWTFLYNGTQNCQIGPLGRQYNSWIQYYTPYNYCPDHVAGDWAEWIAERTVALEPVTKFGSLTMLDAEFFDYSLQRFFGAGNTSPTHVIMNNSCMTISTPRHPPVSTTTHPISSSIASKSVGFTWNSYGNSDPNSTCK